LLSGIVLLFLVERTLIATSNPNYAPSVILLGAFLVPITFETYLYERLPSWDVSLPALAVCFLWGGVLGTVIAGTLEYDVARSLGFLPKLAIGLIEESAKLIVPLADLAIKSATHEWNWHGREIGRPGLHQPDAYAVCELSGVS
jgi:RsiW-degrading membrane proteinase PrsW (M82 family)